MSRSSASGASAGGVLDRFFCGEDHSLSLSPEWRLRLEVLRYDGDRSRRRSVSLRLRRSLFSARARFRTSNLVPARGFLRWLSSKSASPPLRFFCLSSLLVTRRRSRAFCRSRSFSCSRSNRICSRSISFMPMICFFSAWLANMPSTGYLFSSSSTALPGEASESSESDSSIGADCWELGVPGSELGGQTGSVFLL